MQRHTGVRRIVAAMLLCMQMLGIVSNAFATTVDNVSVASAALTANASAIDGMVRVYLSSLGNPSTLNLTVVGNYSVNGDTSQSVASGGELTVQFSASTGAITLSQNGGSVNMGKRFTLRRHSASGTNGVKISQSRESANPYPGDLSFEAVQQSGGGYKLYTIAHIYIENYLYGVLPYEMGNSSSLEALKAQAVAARTYTVRMMQSRASGLYDVVDTTSDQVYRGTPSGNANCVAAVDATKGVVLKNGSSYTMTYYSASNGGQTESAQNAWGKSGYDYLVVKDDPFDLANPSSTVKSKTVYQDLTSASNPQALISLLQTKAVSALAASGYGATGANTTLQTLKSVTPHSPKYASPSKLYTKMDFALTASTLSASGASVTASVTVTCDIFSELESRLSMSIQSSQNELWSVKNNGSSFTLQARRYGHGLGMSQRGAMYMGKLGYTYDEILGFYYEGCQRVRQSFTHTILSASSGSEETTVEDAADLTGDISGACKGTVRLVRSGSSLAIRSAKSTGASLIGTAGNGAMMTVLSSDGTWCFVQYGELKGYVPQNALTLSGSPAGADGEATQVIGFATVTANDYVNLRSEASMSGSVLTTAPYGAVLTVFSTTGGWARVQYCATAAYVNMSYISSVSASYPSSVASTGSVSATIKTEDGIGTVNLRATASTSGSVLAQLPSGTQVTVVSDDGSWATVSYNGVSGYIQSSFLAVTGDSLENNGSANTGGSAGGSGSAETAVYATVSAELTYLREAQSEASASVLILVKGDTVRVTQKGSEWCAVQLNDISGYLPASVLTFGSSGQSAVAKATVSTSSGSLNLRSEAKAGSSIITTIPRGAEVEVTSVGATWCGVRYLSMSGYAMTSFLRFTEGGGTQGTGSADGSAPSDGSASPTSATVTTQSGSLNLRAEGRSGSAILLTIPQYAAVTVYARATDWCRVSYNGVEGYVMTVFLTFQENAGTASPAPSASAPPAQDTATVNTVSGSLNLRTEPNAYSGVLTRIPQYATVTVTQRGSEWCGVRYGGYSGYVMTAYLLLSAAPTVTPAPSPAPTATAATTDAPASTDSTVQTATPAPSPTPAPTQQPENSVKTATVTTASGSLNLRSAPQSGARIVTTIPQHAKVTVVSENGEWCQIAYGAYAGYAMSKYLTISGAASGSATPEPQTTPTAGAAETTAWVLTASGSLNLRVSPSGSAGVIVAIPRYSQVTVLSEQSGWSYLRFNGMTGYAMSAYLTKQNPSGQSALTATPTPSPTSAPAARQPTDGALPQHTAIVQTEPPTPTPPVTSAPTQNAPRVLDGSLQSVSQPTFGLVDPKENQSRLSIWPECVEHGVSLIDLERGAEVEVLEIGNTWCQVRYGSISGYCLTLSIAIRGN